MPKNKKKITDLRTISKIIRGNNDYSMVAISNPKGLCYINVVLISLFACPDWNTAIRKYIHTFEDEKFVKMIESGKNVYKDDIIFKLSKARFYEFVLISYYIIYCRSTYTSLIESFLIEPFIVYALILSIKYARIEKFLAFVKSFKLTVNPFKIDEANDSFAEYYQDFKNIDINMLGGSPVTMLFTLINMLGNVMYKLDDVKRKKELKELESMFSTNAMYGIVTPAFVKENPDIIGLSTLLLIFKEDNQKYLGLFSEKCGPQQEVDSATFEHAKTKKETIFLEQQFLFPEYLTFKKNKMVLIAKGLATQPEESVLHAEVIVREHKTGDYYRISNAFILKCGTSDTMKNYQRPTLPGYIRSCDSFKCFDNFVDFALYHVM